MVFGNHASTSNWMSVVETDQHRSWNIHLCSTMITPTYHQRVRGERCKIIYFGLPKWSFCKWDGGAADFPEDWAKTKRHRNCRDVTFEHLQRNRQCLCVLTLTVPATDVQSKSRTNLFSADPRKIVWQDRSNTLRSRYMRMGWRLIWWSWGSILVYFKWALEASLTCQSCQCLQFRLELVWIWISWAALSGKLRYMFSELSS